MKNTPKLIIGFSIIIGAGFYFTLDFQQNSLQPLELAMNHLDRIMVSSEPSTILSDIYLIKQNVPNDGNPVFIYPTPSTDFARIQSDLDIMVINLEKISSVPIDSSAYHIGMSDMHSRSNVLRENIMDAKSYLYGSLANVFFNSIWLVGTMGLVETLTRKSESLF